MKILLVDAYDSFVFIIKNYLNVLGVEADVVRYNKLDIAGINERYSAILLGPGPGHPKECRYLEILDSYEKVKPIFGVCLGMQSIAEYYGVPVVKANSRKHGKVSQIQHFGEGCFSRMPNPLQATRYHSLIADHNHFNDNELTITATSADDHYIMGLRHRKYPIEGVQFHPESICTENGSVIFENFIYYARVNQG